jgi:hypothetical protein
MNLKPVSVAAVFLLELVLLPFAVLQEPTVRHTILSGLALLLAAASWPAPMVESDLEEAGEQTGEEAELNTAES